MKNKKVANSKERCPDCDTTDVRFRVSLGTYLCRKCGRVWTKNESKQEPEPFVGKVPEGYIVVSAHNVPARHVPAHLRPIQKARS